MCPHEEQGSSPVLILQLEADIDDRASALHSGGGGGGVEMFAIHRSGEKLLHMKGASEGSLVKKIKSGGLPMI